MHWNHGKDAKPQSGKINCTVLIGLTQVGKAALPEAKEECRTEGKRIYFFYLQGWKLISQFQKWKTCNVQTTLKYEKLEKKLCPRESPEKWGPAECKDHW